MRFNPPQVQPESNKGKLYVELKNGDFAVYTFHKGYWFDGSEVEKANEKIARWCYCSDIIDRSPLGDLVYAVEKWAEARNLINGSSPQAQFVKLIEEAGELAGNIARGKDVRDDIGDMLVVLTIIAAQSDSSLRECLSIAYDDIKDRKGKMLDGVFVKEETQICENCGESFIDYCEVCNKAWCDSEPL